MNKKLLGVLLVLSFIGGGIIWFASSPYGIGLSPDSVTYIAVARHVLQGQGLTGYDGMPHTEQPPFYPLVLASAAYVSGSDPLQVARPVSVALVVVIIFLSGLLFLKYLKQFPELAVLGAVAIVVAPPVINVGRMAWSEPLFISLMLLSLLLAHCYLKEGTIPSLALFALSLALTSLTRYIGFAFLAVGAFVVMSRKKDSMRAFFCHFTVYLLWGGLLPALWLARNFLVSGSLFGTRAPAESSFLQNVSVTIWKIWRWYFPPGLNKWIWIVVLVMLGELSLINIHKRWNFVKTRDSLLFQELASLLLYVTIYALALVAAASQVAFDQIGDRLLSPLYPISTLLLWLFLAWSIVYFSDLRDWKTQSRTRVLLALVLIIWLIYPASKSRTLINLMRTEGRGYNNPGWRHSRVLQYLKDHQDALKTQCSIYYTNDPQAFYLFINRPSILSPQKRIYRSSQTISLEHLRGRWPKASPACLVWFAYTGRTYLFSPEELRTIARMTPIVHFDDEEVYLVWRR